MSQRRIAIHGARAVSRAGTAACPHCDARVRPGAARCRSCRAQLRAPRVSRLELGLIATIVALIGIGTGGLVADRADDAVRVLPPGAAAGDDRAQIRSAIRSHWDLRARGDEVSLEQAYAYYTGPMRAMSVDDWSARIAADGEMRAHVSKVWITRLGADRAAATAKVRTTSAGSGCQVWMIRYDLRREHGTWLLADATQGALPCRAGA